jgi:putative FmdB family regulatory protein
MPTYTYQCSDCGTAFEQYQKFSEDPLTDCPSCTGSVRRVIHAPGIVFKGSGWYINDSRKGGGESSSLPAANASTATDSAAPATTPAAASSESAPAPVAAKAAD